jgi:cytochrome c
MACHSLNSNSKDEKVVGPALGLIFRRRAGLDIYYQGYSLELAKVGLPWTENRLFGFLKAPREFIPGTRCGASLDGEMDRADIICFLK